MGVAAGRVRVAGQDGKDASGMVLAQALRLQLDAEWPEVRQWWIGYQ